MRARLCCCNKARPTVNFIYTENHRMIRLNSSLAFNLGGQKPGDTVHNSINAELKGEKKVVSLYWRPLFGLSVLPGDPDLISSDAPPHERCFKEVDFALSASLNCSCQSDQNFQRQKNSRNAVQSGKIEFISAPFSSVNSIFLVHLLSSFVNSWMKVLNRLTL